MIYSKYYFLYFSIHSTTGIQDFFYLYDIGVMWLETLADTSSAYISTIQMAPADEDGAGDYAGTECVMTGWGRTGELEVCIL